MPIESSSDANSYDGSYNIDYNQFKQDTFTLLTKNTNNGTNIFNRKTMNNTVLSQSISKNNTYTFAANTANTYNNFMDIYLNNKKQELTATEAYSGDIANKVWVDYPLFMGARNGEAYFTKMNLLVVRIYNRSLTKEELENNYEIDKIRFDI